MKTLVTPLTQNLPILVRFGYWKLFFFHIQGYQSNTLYVDQNDENILELAFHTIVRRSFSCCRYHNRQMKITFINNLLKCAGN